MMFFLGRSPERDAGMGRRMPQVSRSKNWNRCRGKVPTGAVLACLLACSIASIGATRNASAQSPGIAQPAPYPGTFIPGMPTIYVLAQSADSPTQFAVTLEVTMRLSKYAAMKGVWIVAEPTWAFADFLSQCSKDQVNTRGAILISSVENDTGSDNYLLVADGYVALWSGAQLFRCSKGNAASPKITTITTSVPTPSVSIEQDDSWTWARTNAGHKVSTETDHTLASKKSTVVPAGVNVQTSTAVTVQTITSPEPLPTPSIDLLWSSQDFMMGQSRGYTTPFVAFAGLGAYIVSRVGSLSTTNMTGTTTTTGAIQKSVSGSTTVGSGGNGLPLGLAAAGTALAGTQSVSVPGTNVPHLLKASAADFATTVRNHIQALCTPPKDASRPAVLPAATAFCNDNFAF